MKRIIFSSLVLTICLLSCESDIQVKNPVANMTPKVSNIAVNKADVEFQLIFNQTEENDFYSHNYSYLAGICWDTMPNPTYNKGKQYNDIKINYNNFRQPHHLTLSNLEKNTTYYVRVYTYSLGNDSEPSSIVYSDEVSFSTIDAVIPTIKTIECHSDSYFSSTVMCELVAEGSSKVTAMGVYYGTTKSNMTNKAFLPTKDIKVGKITMSLSSLQAGTEYFIRAFAKNEEGESFGEILTCTTPEVPKMEAVELGLSVKWASMTLGAISPGQQDVKFSWAETEPRDPNATKITNKYVSWFQTTSYYGNITTYYTITKYGTPDGDVNESNKKVTIENIDNLTTVEPEDDAAHVILGDSWRLPTIDEARELVTKCTIKDTVIYGENLQKVTGPNGNYILFQRPESKYIRETAYIYYWTSSLNTVDNIYAFGFKTCFRLSDNYNSINIESLGRLSAVFIRPVYPK